MSAAVETLRPAGVVPAKRGRWIDDWRPEDPAFWADGGARVARRNLIFSIFSKSCLSVIRAFFDLTFTTACLKA